MPLGTHGPVQLIPEVRATPRWGAWRTILLYITTSEMRVGSLQRCDFCLSVGVLCSHNHGQAGTVPMSRDITISMHADRSCGQFDWAACESIPVFHL